MSDDLRNVIIIGASGHGKVIASIIENSGDKVVGFLDDDTTLGDSFNCYPILGIVDDFRNYTEYSFIVAIGNPTIRERIVNMMDDVQWHKAIHPSSIIAERVRIGSGTVVMPGAIINADSVIGKQCIINSSAVVEHDNIIEDYAHISVGAKCAGTVHIGYRTWIGVGASISNNITICNDCMIGAGGVVVNNILESGTYVGVPVRRIDSMNEKTGLHSSGGVLHE